MLPISSEPLNNESHYRTLAEASFEGIVLSNRGIIIDANQQLVDILGYTLPEILGKSLTEFVVPEDMMIAKSYYNSNFEYQVPHEHRLLRKDGSAITVETRAKRFEKDGHRFLVTAIRDITERKKAEMILQERTAQLENANKELESFSYSVSHDLKAPLRAIDGYSKILLRKYGDKFDEDVVNKLSSIRNNVVRMGQLIEDLLSFSGVIRKSMKLSEINMGNMADSIWKEIQAANPERKELHVRIKHLQPVIGDCSLIKQVFYNLLSNAAKFVKGRNPGMIEISSYNLDDEIVYYVKDNGVGFDMRYYDKLFNVFQRLHSEDEYDGTGVGLAIVQRIIQRHGGRVWAEAETDKGATFYFTLPTQKAMGPKNRQCVQYLTS